MDAMTVAVDAMTVAVKPAADKKGQGSGVNAIVGQEVEKRCPPDLLASQGIRTKAHGQRQ